jgi:hypothetical protein
LLQDELVGLIDAPALMGRFMDESRVHGYVDCGGDLACMLNLVGRTCAFHMTYFPRESFLVTGKPKNDPMVGALEEEDAMGYWNRRLDVFGMALIPYIW